jgi:hypothetical protein
LEAVFDGATPDEQPLQKNTAPAVATQASCFMAIEGEESIDMEK